MEDNRKREKIRQTGCEVSVPKFKFTTPTASKRRDEDCATTFLVPRKVYVPEEGRPDPGAPFAPLSPLIYGNLPVTITCPENTFGADVVAEAGTFTTSVSFYSPQLPRLTDTQERYIVSVIDTIRPVLEGPPLDTSELRSLLKVSIDYATILSGLINTATDLVNTLALEAATDASVCLYRSQSLIAYCPEGTTGDSISREEGFRTSAVSQEDANLQAQNATEPECFFCNEETVVNCPPSGSDIVSVSGNIVIPAGTICDTDRAAMLSRLQFAVENALDDCLYCNKLTYTKECPSDAVGQSLELEAGTLCFSNPEDVLQSIIDFEESFPDCDYFNNQVDCKCDKDAVKEVSPLYEVIIPAGTIPGESVEDATIQAQELCTATLRCRWQNEAQRDAVCGLGEVAIVEGFVPKKFFTSDISQEDADEQAKTLATLLKQCAEGDDGGGGGGGGPGGPGGRGCNSVNTCGDTAGSQDLANWVIGQDADGKCKIAGLMSLTQGAGNVPENEFFDLLCRYDIKFVDCEANEILPEQIPLYKSFGIPYSYRLHIKRPDDIHTAKTCKECMNSVSVIHSIQQPPDDKPLLSPLKQLNLKGVRNTDDISVNEGNCLTFNTRGYTGVVTVVTDVSIIGDLVYKNFANLDFKNGLLKTVDGYGGGDTTVVTEIPTDITTEI